MVVLYSYSTSNHNVAVVLDGEWGVVLYSYSTSNHNWDFNVAPHMRLCYISIPHQTTTLERVFPHARLLCYILIPHQTPTYRMRRFFCRRLCYIYILHQTTTEAISSCVIPMLYYISILHQTTTRISTARCCNCYILIPHQTTTSGGLSVDNALFMRQIGCPKMCLRDPKKRK